MTFTFPCDRWLAKDEEDGAIVRELVPEKVLEERMGRDGQVKMKERRKKDSLIGELNKRGYRCVHVYMHRI